MIYYVDDDAGIRELILYTLNRSGYRAEGFGHPAEFWSALKNRESPELVLLDITLPEEDGLSVLRRMRNNPVTQDIPVIMVSSRAAEYDIVIALDAGADDYIVKPIRMMELLARIRALLRRVTGRRESNWAEEYRTGALYVSPSSHIVTVAGRPVSLTLKEFDLLCMLMDNTGIVLTRDRILDKVWRDTMGRESRTVDVHIRTLRQKLGDAGEMIETVRGIGYKFIGRLNEESHK